MNGLSWFLIFVDIYSNLKTVVAPLFFIIVSSWLVYVFIVSLSLWPYYMKKNRYKENSTYHEKEWADENRDIAQANAWFNGKKWWPTKGIFVVAILSACIWLLTPSVQTLYLVASSEAAEIVVFSEEGKAILQDLREVLDAQLEALKSPITTP